MPALYLGEQPFHRVNVGTFIDEEKFLQDFYANYYNSRRTGKVYQTKVWKSAVNESPTGIKLLDNTNLVCEPSTATLEGRDDYANIPLFDWTYVNYIRERDGSPKPIAVKGDAKYKETGNVDVGSMMMSFYYAITEDDEAYYYTISDMPNEEYGLVPFERCVKADGTVLPWLIYAAFPSVLGEDGLLHSQPNKKPERFQSHNNMITNYGKKGEGYEGCGSDIYTFAQMMMAIKYGTKDSQSKFSGCTRYDMQCEAIVSKEMSTNVILPKVQAGTYPIGNCVSIGYADKNTDGTLNTDRGKGTMHKYADNVRILGVETVDETTSKLVLDSDVPFNTLPVDLDGVSSPILVTTMHCYTGQTMCVIGKHDGQIANDGKHSWRIQGVEFHIGGYEVASETVMFFKEDYSKDVYKAKIGTPHTASETTIKQTYEFIGNIPASANGNGSDYQIGDLGYKYGCWYPKSEVASNVSGTKDRLYAGGMTTTGSREYLQGGGLWSWSAAGVSYLLCRRGLDGALWYSLSRD